MQNSSVLNSVYENIPEIKFIDKCWERNRLKHVGVWATHYVANDTTSGIPQQQIAVARDEYVPRAT